MDTSTNAESFHSTSSSNSVSLIKEITHVMQVVSHVVLCGIISLFGVAANIVNICVFVRQGLKDSINISLMGLAISDLASSVAMVWISISFNPMLLNSDLNFNVLHVQYVTGGWPHVCFNRITGFITVFITVERCLCIAKPLKVKNIVTPFRTKVIISSIFLSMFILFSPSFIVNKLEWVYTASRNRSIYGLTFTDNREIIDSVTFFLHSVTLSLVFLISVVICTLILIMKLNEKTKWRNETLTQTNSKPVKASVKDKKVVMMITLISVIYIICYVPPTVIFLLMACNTEISITGKLNYIFFIAWSVAFFLESVNSSVNVFVYFTMSSKFKVTFTGIFCSFYKGNKGVVTCNN